MSRGNFVIAVLAIAGIACAVFAYACHLDHFGARSEAIWQTRDAGDSSKELIATALISPAAGAVACLTNSVRRTEQCYRSCDDAESDHFLFKSGVCGVGIVCECPATSEVALAGE